MSFEAQLWREVSRHVELAECARRVAPILRGEMPVDFVLIRRLIGAVTAVLGLAGIVALIGEYGHRQITHAHRNDFRDDPGRWGLEAAEENAPLRASHPCTAAQTKTSRFLKTTYHAATPAARMPAIPR